MCNMNPINSLCMWGIQATYITDTIATSFSDEANGKLQIFISLSPPERSTFC